MKKTGIILGTIAGICLAASLALGGKASVEYGKELFNDKTLGGSTNEKSCNSCHLNGDGLENAWGSANLATVINTCIEKPLKGKKLDESSIEMESIKMYIKSLKK